MLKINNKLSILLVLLWMIIIFIMSSFDATESANQSSFIVNIINDILKIENVHKSDEIETKIEMIRSIIK